MKQTELYPVGNHLSAKEVEELTGQRITVKLMGKARACVRAKWTGEFRPPKAGEWYLSGGPIEAWKAPNDLSTAYHIAKLVMTETITITREVQP